MHGRVFPEIDPCGVHFACFQGVPSAISGLWPARATQRASHRTGRFSQRLSVPMKIRFRSITAAVTLALAVASPLAHADCFDEAARYQKVNPLILRAIAWQESHNRPDAVNRNANGSTDYGVMQINSVHLPTLSKYGISQSTLMEPCKNVYIAAWHLRQKMNKYGNTWAAVGAYHSESPPLRDRYAQDIAAILRQWNLLK
jgi:soluble lytic murein transglycosylase-like protein